MSSITQHLIRSFVATAALEPYIRVKLSSGQVVVAGLNEAAIGVTHARVAAGGLVPVSLFNGYGTTFMTAAAAITSGAAVRGAASGKIDDTGVGPVIGYALEAATAAGDVIEVLTVGSIPLAATASADQAVPTDLATAIAWITNVRTALIANGTITGAA